MKHLKLMVLPLVLAACVPAQAPSPAPDGADTCNTAAYEGLIGQPRSALDRMTLPAGARVIGKGDAVTADFSAGRLNFELDAADRVEKTACY